MSVGIAIQAHPNRRALAEGLARQLSAPIAWSRSEGDVWDTHRRARMLCDPAAEWNLVIQDDAILAPRFLERLEGALVGPITSLFFRRRRKYPELNAAAEAGLDAGGCSWPELLWGVGVAIRTELVPDMVATGDCIKDIGADRDDERVSRWAQKRGYATWYALPSLVNHRANVRSLVYGQTDPHRVAWKFAA